MTIFEFDIFSLFTIGNLIAILVGTTVGLIFGALPGLGAILAMVILLPITYSMSPLAAILMLLATFQAAEYGGSISSVAIGIPGTAAAAATTLDGFPMAKKGQPGKALAYSLVASTIGGFIGGLALLFLAQPFAKFGLQLSEPEYFLLGILGLIAVAALSTKNTTNSLISIVLGLMAGTVGLDMFSGELRYTMGQFELLEGISILPLIVAAFAFPEIFKLINSELKTRYSHSKQQMKIKLTAKELKDVSKPTIMGSILGVGLGIIPGLGPVTSSWFAYAIAKKTSKKPEEFGHGNPEGIAAPEAANNSVVASSIIPLLALGIPSSVTSAIIMGAFIIHGIQPGPRIFQSESNLVYGIIFGFLITTVFMYVMGKFVTSLFSRALMIPNPVLIPVIIMITLVGVYAEKSSFFDLWIALFVGVVFYFLVQLNFSMPGFVIAFVLAPIIEESFRRALIISGGDFSIFYTRGYSIVLLLFIVVIALFPIVSNLVKKKKNDINVNDQGINVS